MSDYRYTPLGPTEIRRPILFPGEFDDPIQGQLVHEYFDPPECNPKYEALSYAWGDQDDPEFLTVLNDTSLGVDANELSAIGLLPIRQNLASALRHLRHKTTARTLWCDAVCINQENLTERSAQVRRMADVYRHACRVVVWLGPGSDNIYRAMELLGEVGSTISFNPETQKFRSIEGRNGVYCDKAYPLPFSLADWQSLHEFFALSWFKRLWVRQEITLANDSAVVMSGTRELRWSAFCGAALCIRWKAHMYLPGLDEDVEAELLENLFVAWGVVFLKGASREMPEQMLFVQGSECSDPRDRIYGMLSVCQDLQIQPDYTRSVRDVYIDAFLEHQRISESLGLLWLCEMADDPSWVPDFGRRVLPFVSRMSGHADAYARAIFEVLPNKMCRTAAIYCGTIRRRTKPMPSQPTFSTVQNVVRSWIIDSWTHGTEQWNSPEADDLVRAVTHGRLGDEWKDRDLTLSEAKDILLGDMEGYSSSGTTEETTLKRLYANLMDTLANAALITTDDGHFATATEAAREGDEIFVILGCDLPMVLRPVGDARYKVIGPCHVPILQRSEAVLGPLPAGWQMRVGNGSTYFASPDGDHTFYDPRLGELPPGWEERDGVEWREVGRESWTDRDPRLTPDWLRARGVKVETLTLI